MTMTTEPEDKLAHAKEQGQAQFDSIVEMVVALNKAQSEHDLNDGTPLEQAEQAIQEHALSVEVRSGWYGPTDQYGDKRPIEYRILLCTGGPAVQIRGDLNEYCEPQTARLKVQDWFTRWTGYQPSVTTSLKKDMRPEDILLTYARCFWFGE